MDAMEKLNRIAEAGLCGIVNAYQGEERAWWDLVDESRIEDDMNDPVFQGFVRLIQAVASVKDFTRAA